MGNLLFENNVTPEVESKYSVFGAGLYLGTQYWMAPDWSIAATIGMVGYDSRTENKDEVDGMGNSLERTTSKLGIAGDFTSLNFSLFYHF